MERITFERFNELFYWGEDKVTIWRKVYIHGGGEANTKAGGISSQGYWCIRIDGILRKRTDLVWRRETGQWPRIKEGFVIDHKDHNRLNDDFLNLREITQIKNQQRIRAHNTSTVVGVGFYKRTGKWEAHITVDRQLMHLGYFNTLKEAAKARKEAELKRDASHD